MFDAFPYSTMRRGDRRRIGGVVLIQPSRGRRQWRSVGMRRRIGLGRTAARRPRCLAQNDLAPANELARLGRFAGWPKQKLRRQVTQESATGRGKRFLARRQRAGEVHHARFVQRPDFPLFRPSWQFLCFRVRKARFRHPDEYTIAFLPESSCIPLCPQRVVLLAFDPQPRIAAAVSP